MVQNNGGADRPAHPLSPGKLPIDLLRDLLERYAQPDARVILGAGVGRDAAVIDFGDRFLVAKSDPITFAAEEIGRYAVYVNANDVATTGAPPRWFLTTILLPEGKVHEKDVEMIFGQIRDACDELGISLCGGHTEVTLGLDRPLVTGIMLGEVAPDALVRPDGTRPGDRLLLTKGVAIEGTAVLAREHQRIQELLDSPERERARRFLTDPGISVVREALLACRIAKIRAMHDPTEGGVATAIHEMAEAAGVGLKVRLESIPIYPETQKICRALHLDPLGLLASGALLIAVGPDDCGRVLEAIEREGIPAAEIGEVTLPDQGVILEHGDRQRPMPIFPQDEVVRALSPNPPPKSVRG